MILNSGSSCNVNGFSFLRRPRASPQETRLPRLEGTSRRLKRLGTAGLVLAAGTLAVFWWSLESTGDLVRARTMAMTQMVMFQFFHVFNSRSLDRSIFRIPLLSNRFLFVSILGAVAAHLTVLHVPALQAVFRTVPLTPSPWLTVTVFGMVVIAGGELDKWWNPAGHGRWGKPRG